MGVAKSSDPEDSLFPAPPSWIEPYGPTVGLNGAAALAGALIAFALGDGSTRLGHALCVVVGAAAGYGLPRLPWRDWFPVAEPEPTQAAEPKPVAEAEAPAAEAEAEAPQPGDA